jgi:acyl dehydratase
VAHGSLVLALGAGLILYAPPMRTLAFLSMSEWHFKGPVFIGDTLRVRSRVLGKEGRARGRRGVITWQRQILNQEGNVVQQGVTLTLVEGRSHASVAGEAVRGARGSLSG